MTDYELHHGDCLTILPALADRSIDAVICDPPYGTTACKWDSPIPFAPMWEQLKRLIKPRGAIVLFGSQPFTSALVMSNPGMFKYGLVWDKGRGFEPQLANIRPMKSHEDISVFSRAACTYNPQKIRLRDVDHRHPVSGSPNRKDGKGHQILSGSVLITGDRFYTDRFPESILFFPPVAQTERTHDTEKPLPLLEYLVRTYTNEGDMVLDFTMGSGTTGHACANTGRRFIGIEKDAHYFSVASERIATAYAPLRHMEMAG